MNSETDRIGPYWLFSKFKVMGAIVYNGQFRARREKYTKFAMFVWFMEEQETKEYLKVKSITMTMTTVCP